MKKKLKYLFLGLGGLFLLVILGALVAGWMLNKPMPEGKEDAKAEALADEMLAAVNIQAWDSLKYLSWNLGEVHDFFWDRERNLVEVKWGGKRVLLNPETRAGKAYLEGKEVGDEENEAVCEDAFRWFANDGFWLLSFTKVRDPGTVRKYVDLPDGGRGLLVTWSSGGVTPGDSYLWKVGPDGLPLSWQLWAQVLPVGGLEFAYSDWITLYNGAKIPLLQTGQLWDMKFPSVKAGQTLGEFGLQEDPFLPILGN
ncbi:MAG: hypothetical protein H6581_25225 [Bacteroidia bacterium]|nr:hypothetical protein [Bacteroidia bacterium]